MSLPPRLPNPLAAPTTAVALTAATGLPAAASCGDLDMVVSTFVSHGAAVYMIPPDRLALVARDAEQLTGARYSGVTRGFLVKGKQGFVLGFEIGGCLLDPIQLKTPPLYSAAIAAA